MALVFTTLKVRLITCTDGGYRGGRTPPSESLTERTSFDMQAGQGIRVMPIFEKASKHHLSRLFHSQKTNAETS